MSILATGNTFVLIESGRLGVTMRTAESLKAMITELLLNSGEEIAFWAEGEAKRCADIWRETDHKGVLPPT